MSAGRKLGYAAAIAVGLLLVTAWAVAAQNPCTPVYDHLGLRFTNCVNPDQPLPDQTAAQTACNNLYTRGYWSAPTQAAGQHRINEAQRITSNLDIRGWSTSGVVGSIDWKFEADTETIETEWGYEDPKTIGQSIADLDTFINRLVAAQAAGVGDPVLQQQSQEARDILDDIQAGGTVRIPYYEDLPSWVDNAGTPAPSFDPNNPSSQDLIDPEPRTLGTTVGHFYTSPKWNPTLKPALEILKCEGWSATAITGSPQTYDTAGIECSRSGWTHVSTHASSGKCGYSQGRSRWVPDPTLMSQPTRTMGISRVTPYTKTITGRVVP